MIVKMINKDSIWVPTPKLFFKILDKTGLKVYSKDDVENIENKLNSEVSKERGPWDFNIRLTFNIKDGDESTLCRVRILRNRGEMDDNCSGCIIFASHRKHSDREELDFDYEFTQEDM